MRTIKVSLSVNGLQSFIRELESIKTDLADKEAEFLKELAKVVADSLDESYGGKIPVTTEPFADGDRRGYVIKVEHEALGFIEFGAGMYSGYGSVHADDMPFNVYPGSWSEEHAGRWQEWLDEGKDPVDFPYNRYPVNAIPKAYNALVSNVSFLARKYFGEG